MKRNDLSAERCAKKEKGIADFELISKNGTLGMHEECELTHVFLIQEQYNFIHYYSLL